MKNTLYSSVSYGNGLWAIIMSKGTLLYSDSWKTSMNFPKEEIDDLWNGNNDKPKGPEVSKKSEVSFSCTHREYCDWNESSGHFEDDCNGYDENSLFVMNENETFFTHTTKSIKTTYYIYKKEFDEENDVYTYKVKSDVGNSYFFVFDINNLEIRAVIVDDKGDTKLLRFLVKAVF